MTAKTKERAPWRTGWCGRTSVAWQHARCPGSLTVPSGSLPCSCRCHTATPEPAEVLDAPTWDCEAHGPHPEDVPAAPCPGHRIHCDDAWPTCRACANDRRESRTVEHRILHRALPAGEYHALTEWWSSTQLKKALPEEYRTGGSQEALDFGTLFHTVVLEPDDVWRYAILDPAKIGVKTDGTPAANPTSTSAWKKAVADATADGKPVVTLADYERARAMRDAVAAHPVAAALLLEGEGTNEESWFVTDPSTGVRHKARFDRRVPGRIVDLKSTGSKPGTHALTRAAIDFGYDLSAAHYLAVAELAGVDATTFTLVFVGKEAPHHVTVCDLSDDFIARGRALRNRAIARLTDDTEPGYEGADRALTLYPPPWARLAAATTGLTTIPANFAWSLDDYA